MSLAKKKKKRNLTLGVVRIKVTFNNTIVSITDPHGNVITQSTAGANGFKGARKSTPHAAQMTVSRACDNAKNEYGLKTVSIVVKGAGSQRDSAIRDVLNHFIVTSITDVSSVAHNGVRPPKRRRT